MRYWYVWTLNNIAYAEKLYSFDYKRMQRNTTIFRQTKKINNRVFEAVCKSLHLSAANAIPVRRIHCQLKLPIQKPGTTLPPVEEAFSIKNHTFPSNRRIFKLKTVYNRVF